MKGVLSFIGGIVGWAATNLGLLSFLPHGIVSVITAVSGVLTVLGIHQAAPDNPFTALLDKLGKGWKTLLGVITAAVAYLAGPEAGGALSAAAQHIVYLIAEILTAVGLYHAQASAGSKP